MAHMLIPIGDHGTAPVPPLSSHNMDFLGQDCIGRSNHRTDIEVMLKVFDGHMKWVALGIKIRHHRIKGPVSIFIDDIAPITLDQ